jgi:hypothetical protein
MFARTDRWTFRLILDRGQAMVQCALPHAGVAGSTLEAFQPQARRIKVEQLARAAVRLLFPKVGDVFAFTFGEGGASRVG